MKLSEVPNVQEWCFHTAIFISPSALLNLINHLTATNFFLH